MQEAAADFRLDLVEFFVEVVIDPGHDGADISGHQVDGVVIVFGEVPMTLLVAQMVGTDPGCDLAHGEGPVHQLVHVSPLSCRQLRKEQVYDGHEVGADMGVCLAL